MRCWVKKAFARVQSGHQDAPITFNRCSIGIPPLSVLATNSLDRCHATRSCGRLARRRSR